MSSGEGFLVVLSDVKSEDDRDYLAWLTTEHVQERLGISGFMAVRIFRRPIARGHRYFIWYSLEEPSVVDSPAYLERLNNPTAWSRRIMPILDNFGRGGGKVAMSAVHGRGDRILAFAFDEVSQSILDYAASLEAEPGAEAVHLLMTDKTRSAVRTSERELRLSDNSFGGLLIVEFRRDESLERVAKQVPPVLRKSELLSGGYREIFSLAV